MLTGIGLNVEQSKQKQKGVILMKLSEIQKNITTVTEAWNSVKVNSEKGTSFGSIVLIWRMLNKVFTKDREQMNEKIRDYYSTFAKDLADEKANADRKSHDDMVAANKKKLYDMITEIGDKKTAEVDKIISKTGDSSLMQLVRDLIVRTEVSDREWQAIVFRVTEAHDYQAGRLLADIAPRFDKYYQVPFDPDKEIEEIERAKDDLYFILKEIDTPKDNWGLRTMHIVGEYDHLTAQQERFERLDSAIGVAVPEKTMTLLERLKQAMTMARENGDNATANAINSFIYSNSDYIDDRQVIHDFYKEEAERLISQAVKISGGR